jgi:hypothetical protein
MTTPARLTTTVEVHTSVVIMVGSILMLLVSPHSSVRKRGRFVSTVRQEKAIARVHNPNQGGPIVVRVALFERNAPEPSRASYSSRIVTVAVLRRDAVL